MKLKIDTEKKTIGIEEDCSYGELKAFIETLWRFDEYTITASYTSVEKIVWKENPWIIPTHPYTNPYPNPLINPVTFISDTTAGKADAGFTLTSEDKKE